MIQLNTLKEFGMLSNLNHSVGLSDTNYVKLGINKVLSEMEKQVKEGTIEDDILELAKVVFLYRDYESDHSLLICSNSTANIEEYLNELKLFTDIGIKQISLLFEDRESMEHMIQLMERYVESEEPWPYEFVFGTAGSDNQKKMGALLSDAYNTKFHSLAKKLSIKTWFGRGCSNIRSGSTRLGTGATIQTGSVLTLLLNPVLMAMDVLRLPEENPGWSHIESIGTHLNDI